MDRDLLLTNYHPRWLGLHLECHDTLSSTNDAAAALLARHGESAHGAVVLAGEQTAGRGRFGRAWHSPRGMSLAMSVALWPKDIEPGDLPLLPLACSLAVRDALEASSGLACRLKWPNDVLCGGKKISGSVAEARWQGEFPAGVVLGIGVNLNQGPEDWSQDIARTATSVLQETGRAVRPEVLGAAVLEALQAILGASLSNPRNLVPLASGSWDHEPGDRLEVQDGQRILRGQFICVEETGALVLESDGERVAVRYGDARKLRRMT